MPERFFTLTTVTRRIQELLQPALSTRFWVKAEISSGRQSKGAFYCDLSETDAQGTVLAQLRCTIWARDLARIRERFAQAGLDLVLADGSVVGMECRVQFHPRYGLSLSCLDMDPAVALGEIELRRRRILDSLEKDGLLERNAALPVPLLPTRIGLITSSGSAAYRDFTKTLLESGFGFRVLLADSAVQGADAAEGMLRGLERLEQIGVDLIVIVRGGGSKTDLAWLDDEAVARRMAACRVPVWTGIGHETDTSILDAVAGRACKTPTAVAEELVARFEALSAKLEQAEARLRSVWNLRADMVRRFLGHANTGLRQGTRKLLEQQRSELRGRAERLRGSVVQRLGGDRERLLGSRHALRVAATARLAEARREAGERAAHLAADTRRLLEAARVRIVHLRQRFDPQRVLGRLAHETQVLAQRARALRAADPVTALGRGFSLTYTSSGQLVRSTSDLAVGQATLTRVVDGQIEATVRKILEGDDEQDREEL